MTLAELQAEMDRAGWLVLYARRWLTLPPEWDVTLSCSGKPGGLEARGRSATLESAMLAAVELMREVRQ